MDNIQLSKNDYTIDYLSGIVPSPFVTRFFSALAAIDHRLCINRFVRWHTGINFYNNRYCLNDSSYFVIAYNDRFPDEPLPFDYNSDDDTRLATMREGSNSGIYLSISGDGLRFLGDESTRVLFEYLYTMNFKCTRIDLACDVYDPNNPYVPHLQEALANVYFQRGFVPGEFSFTTNLSRAQGNIRKFSNVDNIRDKELLKKIGVEVSPNCFETINYTWGRKDSTKCQFRLYDKWLEVATSRRLKAVAEDMLSDIPTNYWYRFEYEMHKQYAFDIFNTLALGSVTVPGAFAQCAEDCFYPVLCGYGKTTNMCQQSRSDIWQDFIELAAFMGGGSGEISKTIHFVSKRFYCVEDRVKYVKSNLPLAYQMLMLLKCYPWLRDSVLDEGRRRFMENKKNAPVLDQINKDFFETNIFCRRDIPYLTEEAFEQLNLDDLILDFPEPVSFEVI